MSVVIVTGSAGLVGAECVRFFADKGFDVVGIDNNMRQYFYGPEGSTAWCAEELQRTVKNYVHHDLDIRADLWQLFNTYEKDTIAVIHCASQPSHDWAVREPRTDFSINAEGTLNLLECTRDYCPDAAFVFCSTSKVYGDKPNQLEFVELEKRYDLDHGWADPAWYGIDETMSIDQSLHSIFGASKVAADVMVQEYGRYFGMKTVCFRGACLTGPGHSGTQLHGFLAYLAKCAVTHTPYTIFGYGGKQVRDNIHSRDLVEAFWQFVQKPRSGEVYNIGAGRLADCSILEAIDLCEELTGNPMKWVYEDRPRIGDHKFFISDTTKFQSHYPNWKCKYDLRMILTEIIDAAQERLAVGRHTSAK